MKEMTARLGLDKLEEYSVETVPDADIVVNANESNWNLPKEVLTQILEETKKFLFNRYPPLDTGKLGRVLGNDLHVEQEQIIIELRSPRWHPYRIACQTPQDTLSYRVLTKTL